MSEQPWPLAETGRLFVVKNSLVHCVGLLEWHMAVRNEHFSCGTARGVEEMFLGDNLAECNISRNQVCILLVDR